MTTAISSKSAISKLIGAIMLISGTSIGAAMLALPVATGRAGLIPSILVMVSVWLYLVYAAFCFVEVQLSMPFKSCNLVSMASYTLGRLGKLFCWSTFLFLLYALNTAYLSGLSSLFQGLYFQCTGVELSKFSCAVPILIIFGLLLKGGVTLFDMINRFVMFALIATFFALTTLSLPHIESSHLTTIQMEHVVGSLSIVLCAFGYHVVIPTVVTYLESDIKAIKKAIWIGSGLPLLAYVIWQLATLGIVSKESIECAYVQGLSGVQLLTQVAKSTSVAAIDQSFAFFAIVTSFLGVALSLFEFLSDGLRKKGFSKGVLFGLAFVPPLYFALSYQRIFLTALEYAGAFGVVLLLALLPACMVWRKRYVLQMRSSYVVPGGKMLLIFFMAISLGLILAEIYCKGWI